MPFALNLRFDLRRLTPAELAERFDLMMNDCEQARLACAPRRLRWSWRGIVRHRWAYPFISFLADTDGRLSFRAGPAFVYSIEAILFVMVFRHRGGHSLVRWHQSLCEAHDIMDELKRRRH